MSIRRDVYCMVARTDETLKITTSVMMSRIVQELWKVRLSRNFPDSKFLSYNMNLLSVVQ